MSKVFGILMVLQGLLFLVVVLGFGVLSVEGFCGFWVLGLVFFWGLSFFLELGFERLKGFRVLRIFRVWDFLGSRFQRVLRV